MIKKLFGGPKTGTAKINGVASQFEGMIDELEAGAQMNSDKIVGNDVEISALMTENSDLEQVNTKAHNIRDALNAIVNGG